ncbi:MAG: non-homologous end-joining DNA ligase [Bacteroidota bacterium]
MIEILDKLLNSEFKINLEKKNQPSAISPMLAKLTHNYFSDKDWIFERKWDGERAILFIKKDKATLQSRNQKKLNIKYPEIIEAVNGQNLPDMIVDGEIVAFDGTISSFSKLQGRMQLEDPREIKDSDVDVYYYVFDLIYLDNYLLEKIPLRERKSILKKVINYKDPIRYTTHRNEKGEAYHAEACKKGWEGIIAKDGNSSYVHARSSKWLKFKCVKQQEFVIGGYTDPEGSRIGFGALLIGFYDKKKENFHYAGKVGTGYDKKMLEWLSEKMKKIETDKNPFTINKPKSKNIHFIKPKLVCEIGFTEWTNDEKLRHPRYLGLREDKKPEKVIKEDQ